MSPTQGQMDRAFERVADEHPAAEGAEYEALLEAATEEEQEREEDAAEWEARGA